MMCTTVLHGGVCHRTSTPHKSGNKMKEKRRERSAHLENLNYCKLVAILAGLYSYTVLYCSNRPGRGTLDLFRFRLVRQVYTAYAPWVDAIGTLGSAMSA